MWNVVYLSYLILISHFIFHLAICTLAGRTHNITVHIKRLGPTDFICFYHQTDFLIFMHRKQFLFNLIKISQTKIYSEMFLGSWKELWIETLLQLSFLLIPLLLFETSINRIQTLV